MARVGKGGKGVKGCKRGGERVWKGWESVLKGGKVCRRVGKGVEWVGIGKDRKGERVDDRDSWKLEALR